MRRGVLGLMLAAFVIGGFASWVALMPKPAPGSLQADAPAVASAPTPAPAVSSSVAAASAPPAETTTAAPATQAPPPTATPAAQAASGAAPVSASAWAEQTSASTRIPVAALEIFADAADHQEQATPGCGLGWSTLAALADPVDVTPGAIEATAQAFASALCAQGRDLTGGDALTAALTAYGYSPERARLVTATAAAYASAAT